MDQKSVGKRIKDIRDAKAWTQEHLAAAAMISVRTVQRAEEGTMSAETLTAIAGALNVEVQKISKGADRAEQIPAIIPILFYGRAATLDWLVNAFGFKITEKYLGPDGGIMHAELKTESGGLIMCGSPSAGMSTPELLGAITHSLNVRVDDVDTHFARAKSAHAHIVSEPEDGYGRRRYRAKDPEGHIWSFAASLEKT